MQCKFLLVLISYFMPCLTFGPLPFCIQSHPDHVKLVVAAVAAKSNNRACGAVAFLEHRPPRGLARTPSLPHAAARWSAARLSLSSLTSQTP
jgi:hypothetical protein